MISKKYKYRITKNAAHSGSFLLGSLLLKFIRIRIIDSLIFDRSWRHSERYCKVLKINEIGYLIYVGHTAGGCPSVYAVSVHARSHDQTKNDRDLKFVRHPPMSISQKVFFVVFARKITPWWLLVLQNCRVTWISAYLTDCLVFY